MTAESQTAFWTYSNHQPLSNWACGKICLACPPLSDSYPPAKPPSFLVLSDGTKVWKMEKTDRGECITKTSRIPQLLQICRLSRQVSLETWRHVLTAYQLDGYRVPWGDTLSAIAWNLHLFHQAGRKRVSEVVGQGRINHQEASLKRKRATVDEEEVME